MNTKMGRKQVLEREAEQYEQKVQTLQAAFCLTETANIHGVYERLKQEQEKLSKKQQFLQKIVDWEEETADMRHAHIRLQQERNELWQMAGVQTEEDFYQRGKEQEEARETRKQLSFLITQIEILAARLVTVSIADHTARAETYAKLLQQSQHKWKELEGEEQRVQTNLAQYKTEIANLEEGHTYSELLHEWEVKKSQLREQMKRWASYAAAKAMLINTKERYHNVRLPQILQTAEQYFRYITNETYIRLFAPTTEQSFIVERKDGLRFSAGELSQATAEQLYLSLRLALAHTFEVNMPLVVDDSFVHFDAERTKRTIALLRTISKTRQVLFFTCHTHLLSFFMEDETIRLQEEIQVS
jgi:uncharacterized protein YhaN